MQKKKFLKKLKCFTQLTLCAAMISTMVFSDSAVTSAQVNSSSENMTSKEFVADMGLGWNLGNSLDSFSGLARGKYQVQMTYSTKNYSGWDAGGYQFFAKGVCSASWTMKSLNSSADGSVGYFGIQLINNDIENSGDTKVRYEIKNTTLTLKDGTEIEIGGEGFYSFAIKDKVTEYAKIDLTGVKGISTTKDLIGATLKVDFQMVDYAVSNKKVITETSLGNIKTTKEIIDAVKAAGFQTVRIPVTYTDHMDSEGNIDESWLNREKEIVDYVISDDMYCIIDVHHDAGDNGWLSVFNADNISDKFSNMWTQIAKKFANYDQRLIFEGINEPLNFNQSNLWDVYSSANVDQESVDGVNKLNQIFVNTVRKVAGNENRFLMVSSYANKEKAFTSDFGFVMPDDTASDKLICDAHIYEGDTSQILWRIQMLDKTGYTCYIGEFGLKKSDISSHAQSQYDIVKIAKEYGISCCIWDDGQDMGILKRRNVTADNYTSKDLWYGADVDYIPTLVSKGTAASEKDINYVTYLQTSNSSNYFKDDLSDITVDETCTIEMKTAIMKNYYGNLMKTDNQLFRYEQNSGLFEGYSWYNSKVYEPAIGDIFTIKQVGVKTYINDELIRNINRNDITFNDNSIKIANMSCKIYYLKIFDADGNLMKDYEPALDEADTPCLYEKIGGKYINYNGSDIIYK